MVDLNPKAHKCILNSAILAAICHEVNAAYCRSIGDASQPAWLEAPEWQKSSAIAGVEGILGGRITKPEESHESWAAQKIADGWKYGEVKDPEAKTHPCLVPYDQLPESQRVKDDLFFAVVRAAIAVDAVSP